jgi:hypothetical protein
MHELTQQKKEQFKTTIAGATYSDLLEIFLRAPDSADKRKAIELLGKAFHDHCFLWSKLPSLRDDLDD